MNNVRQTYNDLEHVLNPVSRCHEYIRQFIQPFDYLPVYDRPNNKSHLDTMANDRLSLLFHFPVAGSRHRKFLWKPVWRYPGGLGAGRNHLRTRVPVVERSHFSFSIQSAAMDQLFTRSAHNPRHRLFINRNSWNIDLVGARPPETRLQRIALLVLMGFDHRVIMYRVCVRYYKSLSSPDVIPKHDQRAASDWRDDSV